MLKPFIPYYILQQYQAGQMHGRFDAMTLFVDMSGFTHLTETFMKEGIVGAEQLSLSLNDIFAPMVAAVYARQGFIPYFAGDAFTGIFPLFTKGVDIHTLLDTCAEIQRMFEKNGIQKTRFGDFKIGVKIGLSVGEVEWGIVGKQQGAFYFRGAAIDQCAAAQVYAQEQQVVFDNNIKAMLPPAVCTYTPLEGDFFLVQTLAEKHIQPSPKAIFAPTLTTSERKDLAHFIPESVLRFRQTGEFRSVVSVFISFQNVTTHKMLDAFVQVVLEQVHTFSGYFKEIDFGDKGGVLVAFFGAPTTFENNTERALECVLAIQERTKAMRAQTDIQFRVGITTGTAFAGIIGGAERVQYAVVGNHVNLAARLMTNAQWGEVLVDANIQKERHFAFQHKGDIHYKGILEDIPTYKLLGKKENDDLVFGGKMVGRSEELQQIHRFVRPVFEGQAMRLLYVYGEAGMGKSRLVYEFKKQLSEQAIAPGSTWITCRSDQILQKPFNPFIYFLKSYFEQSSQENPQTNKNRFEHRFVYLQQRLATIQDPEVSSIIEELKRTKPILAALVGIRIKNSIWEQLDGRGRYQNTFAALSNILLAEAKLQPFVLELEDGHWFDDSSKTFLNSFLRVAHTQPVLVLVTSRYADDGTKPSLFEPNNVDEWQVPYLEIDLNILKPSAIRDFAETYLKGKVSGEFLNLLKRTTNGNPFYLEQILEYFYESQLLKKVKDTWHIKDKNIKLSNSVNAILMARIDRLSELVKETVKAAAVIGYEFEVPVLSEVLKVQDTFVRRNGNLQSVLQKQIQTAERGQIWRAMNELRYIFKHSLLREAVYDMQLRTRLRALHQSIAKAIEKIYVHQLEERYVDLAFHYEQAECWEETKNYLVKAGKFANRNYQNREALRFFEKALTLINAQKEYKQYIDILLRKGEILEQLGDWDNSEMALTKALECAMFNNTPLLEAKANNQLGKLLMLKGLYEEARHHLETAVATFETENDEYGISIAYGNLGNLFFRQGAYDNAKDYFVKSIDLSRLQPYTTATTQIVSNLGLTYMNQGAYEEGIRCQEEQLELALEMGDKQGMATLYTNLGIVFFEKGDNDNALSSYQKGLKLSQALGNKLLMSIAIGCIGSVYERKGDFQKAQENYEYDLKLCNEMGDKQGIAIVHGLLGDLYALKGDFQKAIPNLTKQLTLCRELHYQKGIAKALNTLGDVYGFEGAHAKAIAHYDEAIGVTQNINNKLVLGQTLIEKAYTLLEMEAITQAADLQKEAAAIAEDLGNPELIFLAKALRARVFIKNGATKSAYEQLKALQLEAETPRQEAGLLYELSKIDEAYRIPALQLYQRLYRKTPIYLFKIRIEALGKK